MQLPCCCLCPIYLTLTDQTVHFYLDLLVLATTRTYGLLATLTAVFEGNSIDQLHAARALQHLLKNVPVVHEQLIIFIRDLAVKIAHLPQTLDFDKGTILEGDIISRLLPPAMSASSK